MINYLEREDLDLKKYDDCIQQSIQFNVFGFSWYLNTICDQWGAYILNDYDAVMPVPWRKKVCLKYVYPPFWMIHLGIYSKNYEDENEFLIELFGDFKFVELRMNTKNSFSMFKKFQIEKKTQIISLNKGYEEIRGTYNRNRRRELQRAIKLDLTERWEDTPDGFISLFKKNVGKRIRKVKESDYKNLQELINNCLKRRVGELLTIYDKDNHLVSGAFFLKQKNRVTELVCASDFNNRKNGANTFMNDRAIYKYQKHFEVFDFGGGSMKKIAKYYKSFGGIDEKYMFIKYNNLPFFLRLFKR